MLDPARAGVPYNGPGGLVDDLFSDVRAMICDDDVLMDDRVEFECGVDSHSAIGNAGFGISGDEIMERECVALGCEGLLCFVSIDISERADGVSEHPDD